jgi:hypothetical protein
MSNKFRRSDSAQRKAQALRIVQNAVRELEALEASTVALASDHLSDDDDHMPADFRDYTPPDPYAADLAKMRGETVPLVPDRTLTTKTPSRFTPPDPYASDIEKMRSARR